MLLMKRFLTYAGVLLRGGPVRLVLSAVAMALTGLLLVWSTSYEKGLLGPGDADRSVLLREAHVLDLGPMGLSEPLPPFAGDAGVAVRLPHRLEPGAARFVNYRFSLSVLPRTAHDAPMALCVPRWASGATVWLNGQLLRTPAPGTAGLMDMHQPELMVLPPQTGPGAHRLDIRLRVVPGAVSGLSPVWFGESTAIRQGCQSLHASQRDARVGNAYLMAFMGLVALAIGVVKRERMALFFGLLVATWCLHHLFVLGHWTSMDESTWLAIYYATRPLAAWPLALFVLSYTGFSTPWRTRGLLLLFGGAYAAFALLAPHHWPLWLAAFGFVLVCIIALLFALLVRFSVQQATVSVVIFCVALGLVVAFNLMEVLRALGWLPWDDRSISYLTVPLLAFGMGALMLERLVRYLGAEERAGVALREEVSRQRAKMAADFLKLQQQAEKIAVLEERKRIVRDMHDGLGSQLVSASALLRSSPDMPPSLTALIDLALLELRSVLDVLSASPDHEDPDDDPVSLLLGKLRHRLGPVFRAQGVDIVWQTESMPRGFLADDQGRLQLLRVLQEAFTNVLKHAQARTVELSTAVFQDRIVVELRDDGIGLDLEEGGHANPLAGHGLSNMHMRALDMGATLKIFRRAPGTSVQLTFSWPAGA
jgi:signal transduction histidine kinase